MTDAAAANGPNPAAALRNAALFAGEVVVPGGSNLLSGNIGPGLFYAALGTFVKATIGLPAFLLVSASSFTRATSGKHLTEVLPLPRLPGGGANDAKIAELNRRIASLEAKLAAPSQ